MTPPGTPAALAASVSCARSLGIRVDRAEVIAEGYSVRVLLRPEMVVTRVVTLGRLLRPDPLPWLRREVSVAGFLAGQGEMVVGPWQDPGPHLCDGLEVSLWRWAEHDGTARLPLTEFGAMLGRLHQTLDGYLEPLPLLVGPLTDIATALECSGNPSLHRAADRLLPAAASWPRRPLHGDAHLGNVMMTPTGPRWIDFEDVCAGPAEWDLASLTLGDEAVAAYPAAIDRHLLEQCRDLRRLQILAGLLVLEVDEPELQAQITRHLDAG